MIQSGSKVPFDTLKNESTVGSNNRFKPVGEKIRSV